MELKSGEGTVVVADRDRCCNDLKNGQQEIKCLIENTAKDQNIIQSVVAALKTTSTTPA